MTVVEKIAEYIVAEYDQPQSGLVINHAKRACIDWFAAMYPGSIQDPNPLLRQAFLNQDDTQQAVIFPYGQRSSVKVAAFLNGASAHTSEFDDIFRDGGLHPGCATIAAALAMGENQNHSGALVLRAIIAGYEVSSRISAAMGRGHYQFWHTTGTIATFGAAAAVATILRLNHQQTAHALATSATLAAGLQQAFRSNGMSKPLHSAHAAETGVVAAMAAGKGITGALDVLEGPAGMGAAMSDAVDWSRATDGLGENYNIESITFKNHGCCGHTFAAIDGLLNIMSSNEIKAAEISKVDISTYGPAIAITDRKNPKTSHECKFSMQYVVAHAAHYGSVRVNAFEDAHMQDPGIRAMLENINLKIDPEIDSQFPIRRAAHVSVTTKSGQTIKHFQHTRKGDPDLPLSDDELNEKFTELTTPLLGGKRAAKLLKNLWRLDEISLSECLAHATKSDCK